MSLASLTCCVLLASAFGAEPSDRRATLLQVLDERQVHAGFNGAAMVMSEAGLLVSAQLEPDANQGIQQFQRVSEPDGDPLSTRPIRIDAADADAFGSAMAADGEWLVVGAPFAMHQGVRCGNALVYRRSAADPTGWTLYDRLVPGSAGPIDRFGGSVSIDFPYIAIGAARAGAKKDPRLGYVSIFKWSWTKDGQPWELVQTINGSRSEPGDAFGRSVAISGTTLVVGAPTSTVMGSEYIGRAYVFALDPKPAVWREIAALEPEPPFKPNAPLLFGLSVAVDSSTIVIGSVRSCDSNKSLGAVVCYERTDDQVCLVQALADPGCSISSRFGDVVRLHGDLLAVAAPNESSLSGPEGGCVYIFARPANDRSRNFELTDLLTSIDKRPCHLFGSTLTFGGSLLCIGELCLSEALPIENRVYIYEVR